MGIQRELLEDKCKKPPIKLINIIKYNNDMKENLGNFFFIEQNYFFIYNGLGPSKLPQKVRIERAWSMSKILDYPVYSTSLIY